MSGRVELSDPNAKRFRRISTFINAMVFINRPLASGLVVAILLLLAPSIALGNNIGEHSNDNDNKDDEILISIHPGETASTALTQPLLMNQHDAAFNPSLIQSSLDKLADEAPKDHHNLVYWAMMLMGKVSVLPEELMLNILDYFQRQFPEAIETNFFTTIEKIPALIVLVFMFFFGHKFGKHHNMMIPNMVVALSITLIPFLANLSISEATSIVSVSVFILGIAGALAQTASLTMASKFGESYTQSFLVGRASAAFVIEAIVTLTERFFATDAIPIIISVGLGVSVIIISAILLFKALLSPFTEHHISRQQHPVDNEGNHKPVMYLEVVKKQYSNAAMIMVVFVLPLLPILMQPSGAYDLTSGAMSPITLPSVLNLIYLFFMIVGLKLPRHVGIPSASWVLWLMIASILGFYLIYRYIVSGLLGGILADLVALAMVTVLSLFQGYLASSTVTRAHLLSEKHEIAATSALMLLFWEIGSLLGIELCGEDIVTITSPAYSFISKLGGRGSVSMIKSVMKRFR